MVPVKLALPLKETLVTCGMPQNENESAVPSLLAVLLPDSATDGALE